MKTTTLLTAAVLFCCCCYSQTWQWTKPEPNGVYNPYDYRNEDEYAHDVKTDANGNVYALGDYNDSLYLNGNFIISGKGSYLAKYSPSGTLLWYKLIKPDTASQSYPSIFARDIVINGTGLYLICNYAPSSSIYNSCFHDSIAYTTYDIGDYVFRSENGETGMFVANLDENGNVGWIKTITDTYSQSGCLRTEQAYSYDEMITSGPSNNLTIAFTYAEEHAGFKFGGTIIPTVGDYKYNKFIVINLSSDGTVNWFNIAYVNNGFFGSKPLTCSNIISDNVGNIFITGEAGDGAVFGSYTFQYTTDPNADIYPTYITKLSSSGNWEYVKKLTTYTVENSAVTDDNSTFSNRLAVDNANNVYAAIVVGKTKSGNDILGSPIHPATVNPYLIKMDNNSNLVWFKSFGASGPNTDSYVNAVCFQDNSLYLTGSVKQDTEHVYYNFSSLTVPATSPAHNPEYFIAKADLNGNFTWATTFSGGADLGGFAIAAFGNNIYTSGYYNKNISTLGNLNGSFTNSVTNIRQSFLGKLIDQYIEVGAITPVTVCPGSMVTIPFNAFGLTFSNANTFTAQLSDSNGDFKEPVNIGTIASTGSGSITANIPSTTPYSAYNVRILSSDQMNTGYPYYAYADTNFKINVTCPPPDSGFMSTNVTAGSAKLNWHTVDCGKGYKVQYRKKKSITNWTTITIATNTGTADITGLSSSTVYQWRIATKCRNSGAKVFSAFSPVQKFSTAAALTASGTNSRSNNDNYNLLLYPNPVSNILTVRFSTNTGMGVLQVINPSGKVMQTRNLSGLEKDNFIKTDVAKYAAGAYFIVVKTGNRVLKGMFVKE